MQVHNWPGGEDLSWVQIQVYRLSCDCHVIP